MRMGLPVALSLVFACSSQSGAPDAGPAAPKDAITVLLATRPAMKAPPFRVQVLTDLAVALVDTGSVSRARSLLSVAAQEAPHLSDPSDRERTLGRLAVAARKADDEATLGLALAKLSGSAKANALSETVRTLPDAMHIEDAVSRDRALARLGRELLTSGKLEEAGNAIARIQDSSQKAPLVGLLATKKLEAGKNRDVDNWLRELDALPRAEVQASIAVWSMAHGNAKAAARALKSIEPEQIRARTLALQAIGSSGPTAAALEAQAEKQIADIQNKSQAAYALEAVVRAWIPRHPANALAILERAQRADSAPELRAAIAESFAQHGQLEQAEAQARALDGKPVAASVALAALCRAYMAAHDRAQAWATLMRIRQAELAIPVLTELVARMEAPPSEAEIAAMRTVLTNTQ
ncbi:MAG: hypothetical protein U1E65_07695 [Myxococcota bacterium]